MKKFSYDILVIHTFVCNKGMAINKFGFFSDFRSIGLAFLLFLLSTVCFFVEIVIWQPWGRLPNLRADCFIVGLCVTIKWQQILCPLQVAILAFYRM